MLGRISQVHAATGDRTTEDEHSLARSDGLMRAEHVPEQTYFRETLGPIAKAVLDCAEAFRQSSTEMNVLESDKHELENQRARFNIWRTASASLISAEGPANDALLSMLNRLCSKVLVLGGKTNATDVTASQSSRLSTNSSSSSFQLDSETARACGNFSLDLKEVQHSFIADIEANISLLFRYTSFIQTINTAEEKRRIERNLFNDKDDASSNSETDLRAHIQKTCPVLEYSQPSGLLDQVIRVSLENRKRLVHYMSQKRNGVDHAEITAAVAEKSMESTPKRWEDLDFPPMPSANDEGDVECLYCPRIFKKGLESSTKSLQWRYVNL